MSAGYCEVCGRKATVRCVRCRRELCSPRCGGPDPQPPDSLPPYLRPVWFAGSGLEIGTGVVCHRCLRRGSEEAVARAPKREPPVLSDHWLERIGVLLGDQVRVPSERDALLVAAIERAASQPLSGIISDWLVAAANCVPTCEITVERPWRRTARLIGWVFSAQTHAVHWTALGDREGWNRNTVCITVEGTAFGVPAGTSENWLARDTSRIWRPLSESDVDKAALVRGMADTLLTHGPS